MVIVAWGGKGREGRREGGKEGEQERRGRKERKYMQKTTPIEAEGSRNMLEVHTR